MANKVNPFLAQLEAQAAAKQAVKTEAHVEFDTIALLFAVHDVLQVGPGRASKVLDSWYGYKIKIAHATMKEIREDKSKKKEIIMIKRDLAARLKEILGRDGWEQYKKQFQFLREYWEW